MSRNCVWHCTGPQNCPYAIRRLVTLYIAYFSTITKAGRSYLNGMDPRYRLRHNCISVFTSRYWVSCKDVIGHYIMYLTISWSEIIMFRHSYRHVRILEASNIIVVIKLSASYKVDFAISSTYTYYERFGAVMVYVRSFITDLLRPIITAIANNDRCNSLDPEALGMFRTWAIKNMNERWLEGHYSETWLIPLASCPL